MLPNDSAAPRPPGPSPFGTIRANGATSQAPVNPFRFTGAYLDGTSALYHLRARQYDPVTGRFTAVDPVSPGIGAPVVGAYVYANDNPVRYTDPSGRCPVTLVLVVLGGLAGSVVPGPGTLAGAAGGASVGAALCFGEIAVEALAVSNAARDQKDGDVIPQPAPPYYPRGSELDRRPSTPLIGPLGISELGYGTPGGGRQLPSPCRALHLGWRACAALALTATVGGGSTYFILENAERVDGRPGGGKP